MNSRNTFTNFIRVIALMMLAALMTAGNAAADTIVLKSAARQRDGQSVITLADIAVLDGTEALRLADTPVATLKPDAGRPLEIAVADVRRALDAAGANWSRVHLSGRSVIVRPARSPQSQPPQPMTPAVVAGGRAGTNVAASGADGVHTLESLRGEGPLANAIVDVLLTQMRVAAAEVRVRFISDALPLLRTPLDAARYEIAPMGALTGDRIVLEVRQWNGQTIEKRTQVSMSIERLTPVVHLARDVQRGSELRDEDLDAGVQWLSPSLANQVASRASVVGRVAARSMRAGEVVRLRDVPTETAVRRGDLVMVRCVVGGVAIALAAEARADGAVGESVEFRKSGERESFLATVTGRGEAVVNLGAR